MRGGGRKCTFTRYFKWLIALKRILLPTMHILLPNYTNLKTLGQFEKLVFVIMPTRENIRLIARSSLYNLPYMDSIGSLTCCNSAMTMDNKPVLDTNKFQKKPYFGICIML